MVLLCLRIPDEEDDDDDDVDFEIKEQNEMRKEKTTETKRGGKRKRKQQHECGVCEKVFVSASQLARHVRTHTKEKQYKCVVCEARFSQLGRATHLLPNQPLCRGASQTLCRSFSTRLLRWPARIR